MSNGYSLAGHKLKNQEGALERGESSRVTSAVREGKERKSSLAQELRLREHIQEHEGYKIEKK